MTRAARLGILAVLLAAGCGVRPVPVPPAGEAPSALQSVLDPRPRGESLAWVGGDVASSTELARRRYVWIFGDTLLGQVRRDCPPPTTYCGRVLDRDPAHSMIANSVGIVQLGADGRPDPLVPYWRTVAGAPGPIFEAEAAGQFLWPLAVTRLGQPLLVAASVHTREQGLYSLGSVLVRVRNPDDRPTEWRYDRFRLPHAVAAAPGRPQLSWATALVPWRGYVYVVGEHGVGAGSGTVLARFSAAAVSAPDWEPALEYLVTDGTGTAWTTTFDERRLAHLIGLPGTSEADFLRLPDGTWQTYRIPPGTFEIRRFAAPMLLGPWHDDGVVYRIPAPWSTERRADGSPRYAAYAAKAHPELGSLVRPVLTYNVNVTDGSFDTAVREAEQEPAFYLPRMVVVP
jgi:hypothetical protein